MSEWADKIRNHSVHRILEETLYLLDQIEGSGVANTTVLDGAHRIRLAYELLIGKIEGTDALLLTTNVLDDIKSHTDRINKELSYFQSNGDVQHIVNASNRIDNVIPLLKEIPALRDRDVEPVKRAIANWRKSVSQYLHSLEKRSKDADDELDSLHSKYSEFDQDMTSLMKSYESQLADFQRKFLDSEQLRIQQFASAGEERTKTFHASEAKRTKNFVSMSTKWAKRFGDIEENISKEFESLRISTVSKYEESLAKIENLKKEAEDVVGIIASTGMAGGYQKVADLLTGA